MRRATHKWLALFLELGSTIFGIINSYTAFKDAVINMEGRGNKKEIGFQWKTNLLDLIRADRLTTICRALADADAERR